MRFALICLLLSGSLMSSVADAQSVGTASLDMNFLREIRTPRLGGRPLYFQREATGFKEYQLGSEWGKKPVTQEWLRAASPAAQRAAFATARVGGATGFYLGTFDGFHVMATNYHVHRNAGSCLGNTVRFPLLNLSFPCKKFFGSWSDIDLALFAIEVGSEEALQKLEGVARNFEFKSQLHPDMPLATVGFGVANNPTRVLVGNEDSDCKVFSGNEDFRYMADPDKVNPGMYKAWSFANGCDVSHGDSGSAMVNRDSGEVVGIIWTGRIPKSVKVQDSSYLDELLKVPTEEVWQELSYAVPASKIHEFFVNELQKGSLKPDSASLIRALID